LKILRPIAAGTEAVIDVDMSVTIPERFGPFGCERSVCTLAGGFYPMLAPDDRLDAPPARADYELTVHVPRVSDVVINGDLYAVEKGGQITVSLENARAAAVIVARPRYKVI